MIRLTKLLNPAGRAVMTVLLLISLANAQCDNKTGFAKQLCQAQAARGGAAVSGAGDALMAQVKGAPLTTSLADTVQVGILPAGVEPPSFEPLLKLPRDDNGAFMLKVGFYEAYLESESLEPYDPGTPRGMAFFPAPIIGRRAKVISEILKYSELHADAQQVYIQNLLGLTVFGTDLEKMPVPTQQAAERILPKETLALLKGAVQARVWGKILLDKLGQRIGANDPKATQQIQGALDKEKQAASVLGALKSPAGASPVTVEPTPRGTWALMPGGFYLRYLPDGYARTRLQVIVPEAAMETVDPKKPLTFDPTQYLAVHTGTPAQRLGITLRPVGGR